MYVKFHPKFLNVKLAKQQGFQSTGTHLNDMKLFLCLLFSHNFRCNTNEGPSGFGFELTFRLKRESGETNPPTWPATLMQALARYVFQTGEYLQCVIIYRHALLLVMHAPTFVSTVYKFVTCQLCVCLTFTTECCFQWNFY